MCEPRPVLPEQPVPEGRARGTYDECWVEDGEHPPVVEPPAVQPVPALDSVHDRIVKRLMTFGGFDRRATGGSFWVSRDDVLRLLEEEFSAYLSAGEEQR